MRQVTHERLVIALCSIADHDPWQLFDEYPEEAQVLLTNADVC